jgi:hypothetical protein
LPCTRRNRPETHWTGNRLGAPDAKDGVASCDCRQSLLRVGRGKRVRGRWTRVCAPLRINRSSPQDGVEREPRILPRLGWAEASDCSWVRHGESLTGAPGRPLPLGAWRLLARITDEARNRRGLEGVLRRAEACGMVALEGALRALTVPLLRGGRLGAYSLRLRALGVVVGGPRRFPKAARDFGEPLTLCRQ